MSKVVFKLTFKHPNKSDTISKNVSHVGYISTRAGVDKTITEDDLKKELEKGVEDISSDDETYIQYINERPRSHGLFGKDGIEDPKEVQEEINQVESFVWRGIISLKEDDAKELGYVKKDEWQTMLRANVPEMADKMGIRASNLRWVAAVHMEKGHPHAHIMFWEKEPEITIGIIKPKVLEDIRKMFTDEIFEEQRLNLLNEKNLMRDFIKELAGDDVSKATRLIKEIKDAGKELKDVIGEETLEGVMPRLYSNEEKQLIEKIKILGEMLPGKGRISLKFMTENVKDEVRAIADYLLTCPEFEASLEKNLKAVEELTKMYTSKEESIQKARDNAYIDIRDRLCQIILRGAAETQKDNIFYVDEELSQKAVDYIKSLNNKINLIPEQIKLLNEISIALIKTGHTDEQVYKNLSTFTENQNIICTKESIESLINNNRSAEGTSEDINSLSSQKKVEYYLSVLKLSGYKENEAFKIIKETIKRDSKELDSKLQKLKEEGVLKEVNGQYRLTNNGIEEFLKVKDLDKAEKYIFKMLESDNDIVTNLNLEQILENKDVFSSLQNKDPDELKLGKYDTKVRYMFGKDNSITFKELEQNIYGKYTDEEFNINVDKADTEIELLENRIEKLTINGYVKFDRESGVYSFTDKIDNYFKYDKVKDSFFYTDEAMEKLEIKKMEFTRYDANVTLKYIDNSEGHILTAEALEKALKKEVVNKTAEKYYEKFIGILDSKVADIYLKIDEKGEISSTKEGKELGLAINRFNKYFKEGNGTFTKESLKEICYKVHGVEYGDKEFEDTIRKLNNQVKLGHIDFNKEDGKYKINHMANEVNKLTYHIYKYNMEGGSVTKDNLKEVLEKNIPNRQAENQLKYLLKRLDSLKSEGYLDGKEKEYILNNKGEEKREDLITPQRDLLRNKLEYLKKLGLLDKLGKGYQVSSKYYEYMKKVAVSKEEKTQRISKIIPRDIATIIDRTQDKIDGDKIERRNQRITEGKYINGEFDNIKATYENVRNNCNIADTIEKQLNNLSTALLVSGVSLESTKQILQDWNIKSNSNIDIDKINIIIDKTHEIVKENSIYGQTTVVSAKDWKEMFSTLGVDEDEIPKWIYKGENWKNFNNGIGMVSLVNDLWKSVWKQLEEQRIQAEMQAQYMKKQLIKQQATSQNKGAMVEQIRKHKDKGSLYREDELER